MVTIKDIANMANVSRGTVDRVLNNRGGVSPRTAERIRMIAEKLNYTPSITGRELAAMKKELKFGFVMPSTLRERSALSRALARKTGEFAEYSISVLPRYYTKNNQQELLQILDELEAEGISGIAVLPIVSPEVEEKINSLCRRGIAVVTYEHDLPDSLRLAHVGCDYYRNGQTIAGLSRIILSGHGKIGIVSGNLTAEAHGQRIQGIVDQAALGSGMEVVFRAVCGEDDVSTYSEVKQMLESHPDVDLLVGNVVSTLGFMRAVKEWDKPIRVITTNRVSEVEPYLMDGSMDAVVTHQPWVMTDMSLDVLFRYLVWGKKPHFITFFANDEIVIAENIRNKRQAL